jgi:hypothetical protein
MVVGHPARGGPTSDETAAEFECSHSSHLAVSFFLVFHDPQPEPRPVGASSAIVAIVAIAIVSTRGQANARLRPCGPRRGGRRVTRIMERSLRLPVACHAAPAPAAVAASDCRCSERRLPRLPAPAAAPAAGPCYACPYCCRLQLDRCRRQPGRCRGAATPLSTRCRRLLRGCRPASAAVPPRCRPRCRAVAAAHAAAGCGGGRSRSGAQGRRNHPSGAVYEVTHPAGVVGARQP